MQEDLLIHGDSVYDIIDKQDHASIQSELMRGLQPENTSASILDNGNEKRIFLCRMNVSRNARRQMRFGDQKVTIYLQYRAVRNGGWGAGVGVKVLDLAMVTRRGSSCAA